METLRCQVIEEASAVVMKLSGHLTFSEMEEFEYHGGRIVANRPALVVIDFSEVDVMTSAGIGALLKLERRLRDHKCPVRIAAAQPKIAEILRIARLDSIFGLLPTVEDAMH